jgi:signal transduction histidine kinase
VRIDRPGATLLVRISTNAPYFGEDELRILGTPVTAIHGFVQTLNQLGDRLSPQLQVEVHEALEQQTSRLAQLEEQLLDLSRVDAEAVDVKPVRVPVESVKGRLCIWVENDGPGVAPELQGALFESFTRAGVARDRVSGTGLGPAIARAYTRAHRGGLRYEARPHGARFVIELPAQEALARERLCRGWCAPANDR